MSIPYDREQLWDLAAIGRSLNAGNPRIAASCLALMPPAERGEVFHGLPAWFKDQLAPLLSAAGVVVPAPVAPPPTCRYADPYATAWM